MSTIVIVAEIKSLTDSLTDSLTEWQGHLLSCPGQLKKHILHLTHSSVVLEAPQVIEKVRSEAHVWNYWVPRHILDGNSPHISERNSSHISDRNSARISCKVCFHGHTTMVVQDKCRCNERDHPKKKVPKVRTFSIWWRDPFHNLSGSFSDAKVLLVPTHASPSFVMFWNFHSTSIRAHIRGWGQWQNECLTKK